MFSFIAYDDLVIQSFKVIVLEREKKMEKTLKKKQQPNKYLTRERERERERGVFHAKQHI